jgi:hypothetical protein
LRALEKDPDRRFQTAGEFRQVMGGIQNSVKADQPESRRSVARSRVFWTVAALVCLVLIAASGFAYGWLRSPANVPAAADAQSPDRLTEAANVEPPEAAAKPAKHAARKPSKSGPNIFRRALKPIWPLSKRDKTASADRPPSHPAD